MKSAFALKSNRSSSEAVLLYSHVAVYQLSHLISLREIMPQIEKNLI